MSQTNQGNPQSKSGMPKAKPGRGGSTVEHDMCGSSDGNGIRFTVPNHQGLAGNERKGPSSPEK